jgi:uncharacterized protein (DUF983 family)
MLSEQMQNFIKMAVTDGVIEQKELDFLRKKALEMGEDPDEAEFTVNAKLQERLQSQRAVNAGLVKKCPACGAALESFQTRCPSCGHELSGVRAAEGIKEFFERIEKLENSGDTAQKTSNAGIWACFFVTFVLGTVFFIMGAKDYPYVTFEFFIPSFILYVVALVLSIIRRPVWTVTDSQVQALVENYPLSNTREDLTEFAILAASKVVRVNVISALFLNKGKYHREWNAVWTKKIKQLYKKAQLSMAASDPQGFAVLKSVISDAHINLG